MTKTIELYSRVLRSPRFHAIFTDTINPDTSKTYQPLGHGVYVSELYTSSYLAQDTTVPAKPYVIKLMLKTVVSCDIVIDVRGIDRVTPDIIRTAFYLRTSGRNEQAVEAMTKKLYGEVKKIIQDGIN